MWAFYCENNNKSAHADQIIKNWTESYGPVIKNKNTDLYINKLNTWRKLIYKEVTKDGKTNVEAFRIAISRLNYIKQLIKEADDKNGLLELLDRQIDDADKLMKLSQE